MPASDIKGDRGNICWWCRHPIPQNVLPLGLPVGYSRDECSAAVTRQRQQRVARTVAVPIVVEELERDKEDQKQSLQMKTVRHSNQMTCSHHLDHPDSLSECSKRICFQVTHLFCSFNCMVREMKRLLPAINSPELVSWMKRLLYSSKLIPMTNVVPAAPPAILKVFSASDQGQTIEQFRSEFCMCKKVEQSALPFDQEWIRRYPDVVQ